MLSKEELAKELALLDHYFRDPEREYKTPGGVARNVLGIGIGQKITKNQPPGDLCVRFYVDWKIEPKEAVAYTGFLIREKYGEVKTDVIETGRFVSFQPTAAPGSSIGLDHVGLPSNVDAAHVGTMGLIVKLGEGEGAEFYVLGSNHVMVVNGRVPSGQGIVIKPPNPLIKKTIFAHTTDYYVRLFPTGINKVDCALAKVDLKAEDLEVRAELPARIAITSEAAIQPERRMKVARVDQSEEASGKIVDVDLRIRIDFRFGTFDFDKLVLIESDNDKPFAKPGDSGALVVGQSNENPGRVGPTALIVGGVGNYTLACSLPTVFEELNKVFENQNKINEINPPDLRKFEPMFSSLGFAAKAASKDKPSDSYGRAAVKKKTLAKWKDKASGKHHH